MLLKVTSEKCWNESKCKETKAEGKEMQVTLVINYLVQSDEKQI
jgi:hypothetical protein